MKKIALVFGVLFSLTGAFADHDHNQSIRIDQYCSGTNQWCEPYPVRAHLDHGDLYASVTLLPNVCSPLRFRFKIGNQPWTGWTEFAWPNSHITTHRVYVGHVEHGNHTVKVHTRGAAHGCNTGILYGWSGRLNLHVH